MSVESLSANARLQLEKILLAQKLERLQKERQKNSFEKEREKSNLDPAKTEAAVDTSTNPYVPLFPENLLPKTVKVAEVFQGVNTVWKEIPLSEFLRMTNRIGWTETLLIDKSKPEKPFSAKACDELKNMMFCDHSAFGFINMKEYGWAAISLKRILKGTKILYSGVVKEEFGANNSTNSHCFCLMSEESRKNLQLGTQSIRFLDAKDIGNISVFFQHAPGKSELDKYCFNSEDIRQQVKTANFKSSLIEREGRLVCIFESTRDIEPFELATLDYGIDMWRQMEKTPALFDHHLNSIPHRQFAYQDIEIRITHPSLGKGQIRVRNAYKDFVKKISDTKQIVIRGELYDSVISMEKMQAALATHPDNPLVVVIKEAEIGVSKKLAGKINQLFAPELIGKIEKLEGKAWSLNKDSPAHYELNIELNKLESDAVLKVFRDLGLEAFAYLKPVIHSAETCYKLCLKNLLEFDKRLKKIRVEKLLPLANPINDMLDLDKVLRNLWSLVEDDSPYLELNANIRTLADFMWMKIKLEKQGFGDFVAYKEIIRGGSIAYRLCLTNLSELEAAINKQHTRMDGKTRLGNDSK